MARNDLSQPDIVMVFDDKMPIDEDALAAKALRRFLGERAGTILRVSQGLSGGAVFRCRSYQGDFALKRWPANTSAERVDEVHAVQRYAGRSLELVPELIAWSPDRYRLTLDQTQFELSTWMPGQAFVDDGNAEKLSEAVRQGAAAMARFHRATAGLGSSNAVAPAVTRRLQRLEKLRSEVPQAIKNRGRLTGQLRLAADLLSRDWEQFQRESEAFLQPWAARPVRLQWVLRDIHREHILFQTGQAGSHPVGIVDFDAVNSDTIASDLARWVGSFVDPGSIRAPLWNAAIAGYQSERTISSCEIELAGAIEQASWYIHIANWVAWLVIEQRSFSGGIAAVEQRVSQLLRRTDARKTD